MKKINIIIAFCVMLFVVSSCDWFLEMPEVTGSVHKEDVFSNRKDAEGMLWRAYHKGFPLRCGYNARFCTCRINCIQKTQDVLIPFQGMLQAFFQAFISNFTLDGCLIRLCSRK